jgi:chaperonin GroES
MTVTRTKRATNPHRNGTPKVEAPPPHPLAVCEPLADRVVLRRDKAEDRTRGGILLPDNVQSEIRKQMGTVVSVGPGKTTPDGTVIPMSVKKGDRVLISTYAGMEIRDTILVGGPDDEYVMVREDDVLAKLPKE